MSTALFPIGSASAAFILTFLGYAATKISNKSYSLSEPSLIQENWFSGNETQLTGLITTVYLLFYAISLFFAGPIIDKFGTRMSMIVSIIATGALTGLFAMFGFLNIRSFAPYIIIWALTGIVQSVTGPCAITVAGNWLHKIPNRGLIMCLWSGNKNLGNILAGIIFGICLESFSTDNWQKSMLICAAICSSVAIPIALFLVPSPHLVPLKDEMLIRPTFSRDYSRRDIEVQNSLRSMNMRESMRHVIIDDCLVNISEEVTVKRIEIEGTLRRINIQDSHNSMRNINIDDSLSQDVDVVAEFDELYDNEKNNSVNLERPKLERNSIASTEYSSQNETHISSLNLEPLVEENIYYVMMMEVWNALWIPGVGYYSVAYAMEKGVNYIYLYWIPYILTNLKGLSTSQAAYISTLYDVGCIFGGLGAGFIIDTFKMKDTILVYFVLNAGLGFLLLLDSVNGTGYLCLVLFVIGVFSGAPVAVLSVCVSVDIQQKQMLDNNTKHVSSVVPAVIEGVGSLGVTVMLFAVSYIITCPSEGVCAWINLFWFIFAAHLFAFFCLSYFYYFDIVKNFVKNRSQNSIQGVKNLLVKHDEIPKTDSPSEEILFTLAVIHVKS